MLKHFKIIQQNLIKHCQ